MSTMCLDLRTIVHSKLIMIRLLASIVVILAIIVAVVSVLSRKQSPSGFDKASLLTVTLEQNRFFPTSLTVKQGDTVTFTNNDATPHQLASDPHPAHTGYTPLNAGIIATGSSVTVRFTKKGSFVYHDHLNPTITGKIVVE